MPSMSSDIGGFGKFGEFCEVIAGLQPAHDQLSVQLTTFRVRDPVTDQQLLSQQ